jgi:hypothetical protein
MQLIFSTGFREDLGTQGLTQNQSNDEGDECQTNHLFHNELVNLFMETFLSGFGFDNPIIQFDRLLFPNSCPKVGYGYISSAYLSLLAS